MLPLLFSNATGEPGLCVDLVSPHTRRGAAVNDFLVGVPSLLFLAALALRFKPDTRRLRSARSRLLWGFYGGAWAAGLLGAGRAVLLAASARAGRRHAAAPSISPGALDVAWLGLRSAVTATEVGAVAFLAAGHVAPTASVVRTTVGLAGAVAGAEAAAEAALVWRRRVPLFRWGGKGVLPAGNATGPSPLPHTGDLSRAKWGWWAGREGVAAAAYSGLVALPSSRWRGVLPARPAFYRYAAQMATLHGLASLGAALLWAGARSVGYCSSALAGVGLGAAFPVLFAAAFLGDFFSDTGLDADAAYYSEMRDAGYFGDDGGGFGDGSEGEPWF